MTDKPVEETQNPGSNTNIGHKNCVTHFACDCLQAELTHLREQVRVMREALEKAYHRLRYIKHHTVCIGADVTHVDGNCIHCLTLGYVDTIELALQEYADARLEEAAKVAEEYWKTGKNVYARHAGRAVEARIRKLKGAT